MYVVVNFTNERALAVVPESWCRSFGKCFWPKGLSVSQITKLAKDKKEPQKGWEIHPAKILFKSMCYQRARAACSKAEDTSDIGTDSDSQRGRGKRKKTNKIISDTDESNSDNDNDARGSKKIKEKDGNSNQTTSSKKDIIPPAPLFKPNLPVETIISTEKNLSGDGDAYSSENQVQNLNRTRDDEFSDLSADDDQETSNPPLVNRHQSSLTRAKSNNTSSTLSRQGNGSTFFQRIRNQNSAAKISDMNTAKSTRVVYEPEENDSIHQSQLEIGDDGNDYNSIVNQTSASKTTSSFLTPRSSKSKFPKHTELSSPTIPGLLNDISDKRFKSIMISMMCDMNEKLKVLTQVVNDSVFSGPKIDLETSGLPDFPITTISQLKGFEKLLLEKETRMKAINKLASWGAKKINNATRGIMKKLISHELSLICNWNGANDKFPFKELKLKDVIIDAVRVSTNMKVVREIEVENTIKLWFKHSKDRQGGRQRRSVKETTSNYEVIENDEGEDSD